ncbi:Gastrula zinc finger protein XlCGF42.1 [Nymphon striatum]|nr:Gastrula zinc finger protein XlCGF42.1 [Nymphon striatum]
MMERVDWRKAAVKNVPEVESISMHHDINAESEPTLPSFEIRTIKKEMEHSPSSVFNPYDDCNQESNHERRDKDSLCNSFTPYCEIDLVDWVGKTIKKEAGVEMEQSSSEAATSSDWLTYEVKTIKQENEDSVNGVLDNCDTYAREHEHEDVDKDIDEETYKNVMYSSMFDKNVVDVKKNYVETKLGSRTQTNDLKYVNMFECDICHKCFTQKGTLTTHMRLHTNDERPFKCDLCLKCFRGRSNLTRHMRIHTKEKPFVYVDEETYKNVMYSSTFEKFVVDVKENHIETKLGSRTHTTKLKYVNMYECDICHKSFTQKVTSVTDYPTGGVIVEFRCPDHLYPTKNKILIQRPDDKDTIPMCDLDKMPVKKITISVTREKTLNLTLNNVYECNQNTFQWKKRYDKIKCDIQIGAAHNGNKMLNYFGSIYGYTNNGDILNLPGIAIELKSKLDVGENNLFQAKSIFLQTKQSYMVINGNIYQPDITILRFRGMILGNSGKLFSLSLTNYVELNSHFLTKSNTENICFYCNQINETDTDASCTEIPSRIVDIEIKLRNDSVYAIINHNQAVVTFKVKRFAEQTSNGGTLIFGASKNDTAVRTYLKDVIAFDKELRITRDVDSISGIIESSFPGISPCFRSTEIPNAYMTRNVTIEFKCWECEGQKCTFPDTSKLFSQSNYFNNDITFVTKFTNNDMHNIEYYSFEKPLHGVLHPISGEANKLFNMTSDLSNSYRSGVLKVVDIHKQSKRLAIQMITTISRVNFEVFLPHGKNLSFVELDHIVIDVNVIDVKYDPIIEDDLRTNLRFYIKKIVGNITQDKEFTFGDILDKNIVYTPFVSYKKKGYVDFVSSKKGKLHLTYKYHSETSHLYLDFFPVKRKIKVEKVDYIRTNFTNPVKITPDLLKVTEINPFGIEVDSNLFLEKTPEIGKLSLGKHVLNKYDEVKSSQLKDIKYTQITYGSDDSISFAVKCDAANKTKFSCSEPIKIMFKMPTTSLASNEINLYNRKTYTLSNRDISMNPMISNHELIIVVKKHPRCGILYRSSINVTKPLSEWRYEEGRFTFEELVLGRIIYKLKCIHFSKKYLLRDDFTVGIDKVLDQDVIVRVNAYSSFTHKDPPLRIKDTLYLSRAMLKFSIGHRKGFLFEGGKFYRLPKKKSQFILDRFQN